MSLYFRVETSSRDWQAVVAEFGSGAPVLYLHGAGGTQLLHAGPVPAPFLRELSAHHQVIVPEHPGYGDAERPDWLETIHDLAYYYLDFLVARGTPMAIVGSGLGGWLALEMAVRDTRHISALHLAAPWGIYVPGVPRADLFMWTRDEFIEHAIRAPQARAELRAKTLSAEAARAYLRGWETTALLAWQPRGYDPHLEKWLHRIQVPVHLYWGRDDNVLPPAYGHKFQALLPCATLDWIADTGHLLDVDAPQTFARTIATRMNGGAA